jgi:CO dehydrogenase/acetyl-CoA synthase alpha subunit
MYQSRRSGRSTKSKTPVIASSPKNCLGLPNRTDDSTKELIDDLVEGKVPGVHSFLILTRLEKLLLKLFWQLPRKETNSA